MAPKTLAEPLKAALAKYQIEATAAMTLGEGPMVWDFYHGPSPSAWCRQKPALPASMP